MYLHHYSNTIISYCSNYLLRDTGMNLFQQIWHNFIFGKSLMIISLQKTSFSNNVINSILLLQVFFVRCTIDSSNFNITISVYLR